MRDELSVWHQFPKVLYKRMIHLISMFSDPLQERLYQMELKQPSEHQHPLPFLDAAADRFSFLWRYFRQDVEKYTDEQRERDKLLRYQTEAKRQFNIIDAFRRGCLANGPCPEPSSLTRMGSREQIYSVIRGGRSACLEPTR